MSDFAEVHKKAALKHGEIFAEGYIADVWDPSVLEAKAKLKDLIPGTVADSVVDLIVDSFAPALKVALLAQVEAISPEV